MRGQRATPGTQIAQLYAVPNLPAPHCTTVHNGGYRASSATQSKLRRVTGEMVALRRRSPTMRSFIGFHLGLTPRADYLLRARYPRCPVRQSPGDGARKSASI